MPIGIPELLIVLVIVLLILGPKRLPRLGKQLGGGIREFKDGITKRYDRDLDDDGEDADDVAALPAITAGSEPVAAVPEREREGETTAPPGGGVPS